MKIDASIKVDAKCDQRLTEQEMLQATGYPAEIADFYSAISALVIVPSLPLQVLHCRADVVAKLEYSRRVLYLVVCGHIEA